MPISKSFQLMQTGVISQLPPVIQFLLDIYGDDVASSWSLVKMKTDAVYPIEIRRSSDDATTRVGFNSNNVVGLDSPVEAGGDLTTWIGASDGFARSVYDQSGVGQDLVQTSNGLQPQIISSGSLLINEGFPYLDFDGGKYMDTASFIPNVRSNYLVINLTWASNDYIYENNNGATRISYMNTGLTASKIGMNDGINNTDFYESITNIPTNAQTLYSMLTNPSEIYYDKTLHSGTLKTGFTVTTSTRFRLGARQNGGNGVTMKFRELTLYSANKSADNSNIQDKIIDTYGL